MRLCLLKIVSLVFLASVSQQSLASPEAGNPQPDNGTAKPSASTGAGEALPDREHADRFIAQVCSKILDSAEASGLPPGFLAKLIWKESRFDPNAISPAGAEGIAQFMPHTAAQWGLENAFEPFAAIAASAKLLGHLFETYGNLGLAAAAYNAGERRVNRWRSGGSGLPRETRNYVYAITGHPVSDWKRGEGPEVDYTLDETTDFKTACVTFRQIRAPLQKRFANTYYNRALKLAEQGDYEGALLRYTVAIRLRPDFAHAYNNRGLVYRKLGQYQKAIDNYDAAIRRAPKYASALNNRGYAKRKLRRYEEAIADYDRAIKLDPNYAAAWFNRGFAKAKLGRHQDAVKDYTKAIAIDPNAPLYLFNRASSHRQLRQHANAERDLNAAIRKHNGYAKAYLQRAVLMMELGKGDQAQADYQKAVALDARFGNSRYRAMFQ